MKYNIIIPAAGQGKRLRPLTNNLPKSLIEINNQTLLEYQIRSIPLNKINKLIFILGYKKKLMIKAIESLKLNNKVEILFNNEYDKSNCAYSLMKAKEFMNNGYILINCDLIINKHIINKFLFDSNKNYIGTRNTKKYSTDLQRVYIENNNIINWGLKINQYNGEVMGPLKISKDSSSIIIGYYNSLTKNIQLNMHCFSLFSKLVKKINYKPIIIDDLYWNEIDTIGDIKTFLNKI